MTTVAGSSPVTLVVRPAPPRRERYRSFNARNFREAPGADALADELSDDIATVAAVFPFKTNAYVCEELIDWTRIPEDPMFQLTFPQRDMLPPADFVRLRDRLATGGDRGTVAEIVAGIRARMNPHPDGQQDVGPLVDYLHHNPSVTDVIFTGGDPLVMRSAVLGRYIEPLLSPSLDHV